MLMFFSMYFMLNPPVLMSLQEAPEIYWWGSSPPVTPQKKKVEDREHFEIACKRYHTTRGATLKVQTTEVVSRKNEEFMLFSSQSLS